MSWNGIVKAVNRATTSIMQNTGAMEKTVDKDFTEQESKLNTLEQRLESLHKEAKGYLDAVRGTTMAQQRIAETIDQFYDDTNPLAKAGKLYKDAVIKMDEEVRSELDSTYRTTVLDPIGKYIAVFPDYHDLIKKRQKKLLDYDRTRHDVKKLVEKPSNDPSKLASAESEANQAKNVYESINQQLLAEIPVLVEMRIPYLTPSFEALVKSQLTFNQAAFYKLDGVKQVFPPDNDNSLEGRAESALQQMRELSICRSN
ncbi:hypothetical protein EDD86DRAFT_201131 [Gorgonomyces haynaldii]|nr:hypothetical protein EDD86DRAFT_201131 [Gorgonomyces haynaldii]